MAAAPAPLIPSSAATRLPDGAALSGVNGPVIDGMQASPTVPSASLLQYGTYDRVGNDLVIHGTAGEQVVVENYFHGHTPATLHAPGGFELAGKTVMALAGEHAPVQVADAGGNQQLAQAASPIGTADKLSGTVTVTRVDGSVVTLQAGDVVYQGDVLQTADGSSIGLVMADGTELSLGSKGRIVLDEMVYDAGNGTGHSSVSLVSGVFSFVSGQIAKSSPDGMQIKTPVATIGIRGTSGTIQLGDLALDNDSQIRVILIPDPNGTVGEIQITTMDGRTSTLNTAFNGLNIGQSTLQSFTMTVHDFVGQYGSVIQNLRSDFSSSLGPINNTAPEQNNAPQNNTPAPGENKGSDASGTEKDSSQQASSSSGTDSNQNAQDSSSAPIKVVLTDTIVTKTTTSAFSTTTDNDTQTTGGSSGSSTGSSSTGQSGSTATSTGSVFNNTDNSLNSSTSSGSGTSGGSTGSGSSGGDSSSISYNGSVIDPHVSGATVFIDYDGDGILDSNEPHTITASDGSYSLTDSLGIGGQVVSVGGIDTVTGLSIGTLTAPSGSSTVTPLTTLMQNLISSGAASSASQAQSLVASALGLNLSSINLTNYDPVTRLSGGSATQASLILSTGVMVQNVVAMITATLVGAGASESSALEAAFTALATAMDGASGRSFLQDPSAISSIISDAASDSSLSGTIDASKVAAAQTAVAQTISSLSAAMETIISSGGNATALLADLSAAARVAQRDAQADIAAAVADGTAESLSNTYSSSSIASLIAQAREEEVSTSGPIEGTSGNDSLTGTSGADDIQGNDGNDWLSGGAGNDRLYGGNGNDTLLGGSGNDLLNGGSGIDTADYSDSTAALTVNLATGSASSSEVGTDTLSSIEVVIGGSGNDSFTGGSGAETFFGGAGDDSFIASAGDDVLNGGDGTDTLDFSAVSAAVTVNLASGTASSTATGSDSLSSIEVVIGGSGNDSFTGGSGTETFFGGAGDDSFIASAGDDVLNGGDGTDTLDFSAVSAAVTINLATGTASSTATGSDSLSSIEVVIGGSGNDSFTGGSGTETFFGGAGDDSFIASAGDDVLNGGDGTDTLDFSAVSAAVTVNLASGTASSTATGSDSLSSIEVVIGGSGNDSFTGGSGTETFFGGAGDDSFIASAGDDVLNGGDGTDTLDFSAVSAAVTVNLASGTASSTATGSDSLSSIEVVIGGSGNDSFTGGSGMETFFGGAGDDSFIASAGDDVLNGGDGTDTLDFSAVSAAVTVNLATGTASSTATGSDSLSS
ncbi:FecR domain-containing protein, partial [Insolitispirillum peregrinum]|uniref:FecR domain-containing protein n=1 Tax=Insolitispirillum peregrinum TaxID=80876 RepID=UPI0036189DAE